MFNFLPHYLKLTLITGLLACISHLAYAGSNNNNDNNHNKKFAYKIGARGPGGGFIFFVDYYDQYPGFTYLEAAPTDAATFIVWCNDTSNSIPGVSGWDANAVGRGRANTNAMLQACSFGGAASAANNYSTASTVPGDWFLPSLGEVMLMYTNLRQAGVGGFDIYWGYFYWSSSEFDTNCAWYQYFFNGYQYFSGKGQRLGVRAVRAF
jgi:hypothetical protein